jgi:uncharacterized protein YjbI with pentapeptide repeats
MLGAIVFWQWGEARSNVQSGPDRTKAELDGAARDHAMLRNADLSVGTLSSADLNQADLNRAYLNDADLSITHITNQELAYGGASLKGAIMLNGQKYEEWLKSKDREEDG